MSSASVAAVSRDCPAYALSLPTDHPLDEWAAAADATRLGRTWTRAVASAMQCLGTDLGQDAEREWNAPGLPLRGDPVGDEARAVREHEVALEACSSNAYARGTPRPARRISSGRSTLDMLPASRLDVDVLAEALDPEEASVLRRAVSTPDLLNGKKHRAFPCSLSEGDLTRLLDSGVAEPCDGAHISLPVFTIPKRDRSSRLLVDGRPFDERSHALPPPVLPGLAAFEAFVLAYGCFTVVDFLGYFLQIPVAPPLRDCLGFRMRPLKKGGADRMFRFTVAIPGISRAPVAAQLCTLGVRRRAGVSRHSLATYDDIGLGGSTLAELAVREKALRQAASDAGVTIRQGKGFSGKTAGVLCGHALDLVAKTVALPREWVEAVAIDARAPARLTCRAASHHIGCFWWAHRVMREPLAARPHTMRLARALGRQCSSVADWDRMLELPDECVAEFAEAEQWMARCPPRALRPITCEWHLWTDAAEAGGAINLLDPAARRVVARWSWSWTGRLAPLQESMAPIRRRELVAALLGCIVAAARAPPGCDLRVFHDNATAESRHRKGSSPHEGECRFLVFAHRQLVRAGVTARTTLVPSACMVADRDSRCPRG